MTAVARIFRHWYVSPKLGRIQICVVKSICHRIEILPEEKFRSVCLTSVVLASSRSNHLSKRNDHQDHPQIIVFGDVRSQLRDIKQVQNSWRDVCVYLYMYLYVLGAPNRGHLEWELSSEIIVKYRNFKLQSGQNFCIFLSTGINLLPLNTKTFSVSHCWSLENFPLKSICWVLTPKSILLALNGVT